MGKRRRHWLSNTILAAGAVVLSGGLFIACDYLYTAIMHRHKPANNPSQATRCRVPDPVRHHALQPNCTTLTEWGAEAFELATNSLGFRDEKIRQVPPRDARPRILLLGDSFTEGTCAWRDTYVGKIAARFPQYDFLNGGVVSYSPSNYLNVARIVLNEGVEIDEVIVFIDISDVQDEAASYHDVGDSGAVTIPAGEDLMPWFSRFRLRIKMNLALTNYMFESIERALIRRGWYHLNSPPGDLFDMERSAWTYRNVSDARPRPNGYAPLGVQGGIGKEKTKMTLLWRELAGHHIPIRVVVYPWPAQVVHETADSRQAQIWRQWCEGKCKRFISVFPAFQAAKAHCPKSEPGCWYLSYFIFGDTHYNEAGNALVAEVVSRDIENAPPGKAGVTIQ